VNRASQSTIADLVCYTATREEEVLAPIFDETNTKLEFIIENVSEIINLLDIENNASREYDCRELAKWEKNEPFDEIWIIANDLSIDMDANPFNPYSGVLRHNLQRDIPYKYFIPDSYNVVEVARARNYFNNDDNLEILPILPATFLIGKEGNTLYNPHGAITTRKCFGGASLPGSAGEKAYLMNAHDTANLVKCLTNFIGTHKNTNSSDQIRFVNSSDLDALVNIYISAYKGAPWNESWRRKQASSRVNDLIAASNAICIVFSDDTITKGCLVFNVSPWHTGNQIEIREMFIDPRFQRQGIGRALLKHVEKITIDMDIFEIILYTMNRSDDHKLSDFFEKQGYKLENERVFMSKIV
jgi:GNAT superfamily N-acetyltransferase